jgi:hypothetical protein
MRQASQASPQHSGGENGLDQPMTGVTIAGDAVADDEEYVQVAEYGENGLVDDTSFE